MLTLHRPLPTVQHIATTLLVALLLIPVQLYAQWHDVSSDSGYSALVPFATDTYFGSSVTCIGNLDGAGGNDIVVGASKTDKSGMADVGSIFVTFLDGSGSATTVQEIGYGVGADTPALQTIFDSELKEDDRFGSSVTHLGDVNGDGVDDIMVGAPRDDVFPGGGNTGAVYVIYLNSDGTMNGYLKIRAVDVGIITADSFNQGARFGMSVESLGTAFDGNVNTVSVAVGAYFFDEPLNFLGLNRTGGVFILTINIAPLVPALNTAVKLKPTAATSPTANMISVNDNDFFGTSIAYLGDIGSNGNEWIAVGAEGTDANGDGNIGPFSDPFAVGNWGAVYLCRIDTAGNVLQYRKIQDITSTTPAMPANLSEQDHLGRAVEPAGDLDGDGVPDLFVGRPGKDGKGAVHIFFLQSTGIPKNSAFTYTIDDNTNFPSATLSNGDLFGSSIALIDTTPRLAIGAQETDVSIDNEGATYVGFPPPPFPSLAAECAPTADIDCFTPPAPSITGMPTIEQGNGCALDDIVYTDGTYVPQGAPATSLSFTRTWTAIGDCGITTECQQQINIFAGDTPPEYPLSDIKLCSTSLPASFTPNAPVESLNEPSWTYQWFVDTGTGPVFFADGSTLTLPPSAPNGTYTLSVTTTGGLCSFVATRTRVVIYSIPKISVNITTPPPYCDGDLICFEALLTTSYGQTPTTIVSQTWTFDKGAPVMHGPTACATFSAGSHTATFTLETLQCGTVHVPVTFDVASKADCKQSTASDDNATSRSGKR